MLNGVVGVIVEGVRKAPRLPEVRICCWVVASFMPGVKRCDDEDRETAHFDKAFLERFLSWSCDFGSLTLEL